MCLFSHSDPKSPDEEFHLSHPIHSDNCILNRDGQGTCPKRSPAYTWRDFRFVQQAQHWVCVKVARYSFSGSKPPKFDHKLRRQKQSLGKIATTVVKDKDENLL